MSSCGPASNETLMRRLIVYSLPPCGTHVELFRLPNSPRHRRCCHAGVEQTHCFPHPLSPETKANQLDERQPSPSPLLLLLLRLLSLLLILLLLLLLLLLPLLLLLFSMCCRHYLMSLMLLLMLLLLLLLKHSVHATAAFII